MTYTTRLRLPVDVIWDFVKDMNNWAPFLTGYQGHECLSDTDSIWTLKGDVGVLARTVRLKAHVTEWNGPARVSFTLTGLSEPVEGGGTLTMTPHTIEALPSPRVGSFQRLLRAIFGFLYRLRYGGPSRRPELPAGDAGSHLTFTLHMEAVGPTGPLVNAMLEPAMLPAAEDLANKIAAHLEKTHGRAA